MEVQFAVAKVRKYAMSESGDTLEMIERPHGGISLVLADGQRSGKSAKNISNVVVRKAIQLLGEGVRDGAAARAAHDYLFAYRGGKVSASLNILSVDARTKTLVISRNNPAPVILHTRDAGLQLIDAPSESVGTRMNVKPHITELPLEPGLFCVAATDGLFHAGKMGSSDLFKPLAALSELMATGIYNAQAMADHLLHGALEKYDHRPKDDISVVIVAVFANESESIVRRLNGRIAL
ncbi:MAG: SpoIIE family protein phosphatase [Anaerolineales bacterium]|nr:SpoIIE family protein phosphatase [Anaerolineales bacterium]MCB8962866.1 SpoIIE family protein phosphatase [Ardenticatenales bacterium]MCB0006604.1 SpoIIE family protein phosphatase [Anaerolineales bacterium]MCB0012920.1 SpoIIE family protein phosphatase [Anaerolineales bacterium]MCB0019883.1 SpoIIE family protein phosphatase [Anaerolineales bacterium]